MADVPKTEPQRDEERLHFLDYWRIVKKRKEYIIITFVLIVFITAVFSLIGQKIYSGESQIKVEQRLRDVEVFRGETTRYLPFDQQEFETHRKLLESREVLEKVVLGQIYSKQDLWQCRVHPNKLLTYDVAVSQKYKCAEPVAGGGTCGASLREVRQLKDPTWKPLHIKWAEDKDYPGGQFSVEAAVSMLRTGLRIRPEKGTRLITIRFESPNPKEAQQIPDMVAEAYIQWKEDQRREGLQDAVRIAEKEIRYYREGGPGQRGLEEDEAELSRMRGQFTLDALVQGEQLIQARDLAQFKTQQNLTQTEIAKLMSDIDTLSAKTKDERVEITQDNPAVHQLYAELGKQDAELQGLLEDYGLEHPDVKRKKGQIASLKDTLYKLADGVLESKKKDLVSLEAYEKTLVEKIKGFEDEIKKSEQALSQYQQFKSRVEDKREMLREMRTRLSQEQITNALPTVDVQLVERAQYPRAPIRPRPIFNVVVSMFVGLTLGTGLAYFVEYLDTSMKNVDDVERYLNLSLIGVIPKQRGELLTDLSPKSHAAEVYRMVWTNIEFARRDEGFKNIMVTSGGVAEGKTTTVVNLGIAIAQMGRKVLVVDSDLRRPKIHKLLRCPNTVGLSDILLKEADPNEVIMKTDVEGLWVLPSGKRPSNVIGLLNSQKMREVIVTLAEDFDVVLYDSPPVMGVSDASVLAGLVDRVLLVIDFRRYPKNVAMRAKKLLENVGGKLVGGVLNKMTTMGGDYYYYYSQAYHHYYSTPDEEEEPKGEKPAEAVEKRS